MTFFHAALPVALVSALGAVLVALHSSLQHELIHGHPTRWRRVNRLLALPPLSLWLPFDSYRISHLMHHRDERLTDPLDDPESYYWTEAEWRSLGSLPRFLVRAQSTLLGRMLIGPFWIVGGFLIAEARAVIAGEGPARRIWAGHLLHLAPLLVWLVFVAEMNLLFYVFGIVYPATAILLVRSFAEHRAEHDIVHRTAIVEGFLAARAAVPLQQPARRAPRQAHDALVPHPGLVPGASDRTGAGEWRAGLQGLSRRRPPLPAAAA